MSGLRETFNSNNPEMKLVPQNGWYSMREKDDENALSIGICYSDKMCSWGYWDWNDETRKKEWIVINVPEQDPDKVKRNPPYTPEEQQQIDAQIPYYRALFANLRTIFPGTGNSTED